MLTRLDRYLLREQLLPLFFGVLITVMLLISNRLIKLVPWLLDSGVAVGDVLPLFVHLMPAFGTLALPLAFFGATMLAYSRLARDNEYVALQALGYSPARIMAPAVVLGVLLAITAWWSSTEADPTGRRTFGRQLYATIQSTAHKAIKPGQPQYLPSGIVLYYAATATDGAWSDVFLQLPAVAEHEPQRLFAERAVVAYDEQVQSFTFDLYNGTIAARSRNQRADMDYLWALADQTQSVWKDPAQLAAQ